MTDDEKRIELLTKWNEQKDETIKNLTERLNYKEGDEDIELKKALAERDYYKKLYKADQNNCRARILSALAIVLAMVAAIIKIAL